MRGEFAVRFVLDLLNLEFGISLLLSGLVLARFFIYSG